MTADWLGWLPWWVGYCPLLLALPVLLACELVRWPGRRRDLGGCYLPGELIKAAYGVWRPTSNLMEDE